MGVSIVVPAYNAETYLRECLDSVLNQTFSDWELILVDDGSKDHTGDIFDEYALKDSRIRVIHQVNKGLVRATETGVNEAKQEYLMFLDADDWYEKDMVERMYSVITEQHADCVNGTYKKYTSDGKYTEPVPLQFHVYEGQEVEGQILKPFYEVNANIYRHWSAPRWDKIYRTEIVRKVCGERNRDLVYGEDLDFCLRNLAHCEKVVTTAQRGYCYRVLDSSMAHGYSEKMLKTYEKMLQAIRDLAQEQNRPYAARGKFEDLGYVNMLYELDKENLTREEKAAIRKMLMNKLNDRNIRLKLWIKKDFPGKTILQKIYRKIRG
ncbi:MAG: glycosyltransferase [Solobacterium sp.]|nr:glycosyltransferase [Solobacterium sp.]